MGGTMRERYCQALRGTLLIFAALCFYSLPGAVSLIPDAFTVAPPDEKLSEPADDPLKSADLQAMELSLTYAGSALWQGTNSAAGSGNYVYCYPYFGLQVIDVSNPSEPTVIAEYFHLATANDMMVNGDFVYVGMQGNEGVLVFDVSDPYNPVLATTITPCGFGWDYQSVRGLNLEGNTLYLSAGRIVQIVDISDPYYPVTLGIFQPHGLAMGSDLLDNYLYIASEFRLEIWDVSDPAAVVYENQMECGEDTYDVEILGEYAYVANRKECLYVVNALNPPWMAIAGTSIDTNASYHKIEIADQYAYLLSHGNIRTIDISTPTGPIYLGDWDILGYNTDIYINGDRAYISDWASGFASYDISTPSTPIMDIAFDSPGMGRDFTVSGNYGFEANNEKGLQVLDLTNPESPVVISTYDTPGEAEAVASVGDYLYLADNGTGLMVFDVTDPYAPTLVNTISAPLDQYEYDLLANGTYLYAAAGYPGLLVYDISSPETPVPAGSIEPGGAVYRIAIQGDYAYLAAHESGLQIVDISDPTTPVLTGVYSLPYYCYSVGVSGNYAYVDYGYDYTMAIIDVSDPYNPVLAGEFEGVRFSRQMEVVGDYLYIAAHMNGIRVFNISDPTTPYLAGQYKTSPGWTWDVDIEGDIVYVTADNGFLTLYQGGCGGPNGAGAHDVADVVFLVAYIFKGGAAPDPLRTGDCNCDGDINVGDAISLIDFIFRGGAPPCGGCY